MNPIIKVIKGYSYPIKGNGKIRPVKCWAFRCPDCDKLSYFSGTSRKTAKDAYHEHRIKNHAGPGLGV